MHAPPGRICDEPSLPRVHVVLLVQTVGVLYGLVAVPPSGTPPSGLAVQVVPLGVPAFTQAWKTPISAAVGASAGLGGIGAVVDCMRSRLRCAFVFLGSAADGFTRSSYERSATGDGPRWQPMQRFSRSCCTSHGRPVFAPLPAPWPLRLMPSPPSNGSAPESPLGAPPLA